MLGDKDYKNKQKEINELRRSLYSKDGGDTTKEGGRSILTPRESKVSKSWQESSESLEQMVHSQAAPKVKSKAPIFWRIFFWGAFIFFLTAVGMAYNSFFRAANDISSAKIGFEIVTLDFADGGDVFPFDVKVINENPTDLLNTQLTVSYPRLSTGSRSDTIRQVRDLSTLPSGGVSNESYEIQLFGEPGIQQEVNVSLSYEIESTSETFVKDDVYVITLRSTPIQVAVGIPDSLVSGQRSVIITRVTSTSDEAQEGMLLKIQYPDGFEFDSASPDPSFGNNVWVLPKITTLRPFEVDITGTPQGATGEEQSFIALIGRQDKDNQREIEATFHSDIKQYSLVDPFINAVVKVDGRRDVRVTKGGQGMAIEVEWRNNTAEPIRNLEIAARLSGNAYDRTKVTSITGFFDSTINTMIFNGNTDERLEFVEPGESGVASFTVVPASLNPSPGKVLSEPTLDVNIDIRGLSAGGEARSAESIASGKVIVTSNVSLVASTIHYSGPIDNFGPMPPVSEETTSYTMVFNLRNTSNDIKNAKLVTELPQNVIWQDIYSPANEDIRYDPVDKSIEWNIGVLPAGTGYTSSSKTLWVQVAVTPSINQIDSRPELTDGQIVFTGEDVYTEANIEERKQKLTTELKNDSSKVGAEGLVKE